MSPRFQTSEVRRIVMPLTEIGKLGGGTKGTFIFGHFEFEVPMGYPGRDV